MMRTGIAPVNYLYLQAPLMTVKLFKYASLWSTSMTTTVNADVFQDLRGVGCPMNLVKTKVAFSKMESGQILGLILDNGPPINNVPRSVVREGHEVLRQEQLDDGTWSVLIRKA